MIKFNQEHVGATSTQISSKVKKPTNVDKVMRWSVFLLSGCGRLDNITEKKFDISVGIASAIIMENGNAMIVDARDASSFRVLSESRNRNAGSRYFVSDKIYVPEMLPEDKLPIDYDSLASHKKSWKIAQSLISENGQVICYDELVTFGKTR